MKCVNCGAELKDGNVFCVNCGKEAQVVPDYNVFEDEYLKKLLEEQNRKEESVGLSKDDEAETKPRKNKKAIIAVVVSLIVVLVVVVGALIVVTNTKNANSITYQMEHAQAAQMQGDYDKAITYYENALNLDPDSSEVKLSLVEIYLKRDDKDSAYVLLSEVIKRDSSNTQAYEMMIDLLSSQGKVDEIIELSKNVTDIKILSLFEDYLVVPPSFSKEAGTYEEYFELSLKSADRYDIYYTVDGSDPLVKGQLYTGPINLEDLEEADKYQILAVCKNDMDVYSDVVEAVYIIDIQAPDMAKVTPDGGTFKEAKTVTVEVPEGCVAYYTWDGSTPNISSTKYEGPLDIPEGDNVLSVILMDEKTELFSNIYRGRFTYYKN